MIGVGFKKTGHTPVPKLPSGYPPPPLPPSMETNVDFWFSFIYVYNQYLPKFSVIPSQNTTSKGFSSQLDTADLGQCINL